MTRKQKKPRRRFTVRIPENMYNWVEEKAEEREVSQNLIIIECIKRNIDYEINARKRKEEKNNES